MKINKKNIKRLIKNFDQTKCNGKIKLTYKKVMKVIAEPYYNIEGYLYRKFRSGKILYSGEISINDVILSQYHNDDYDNYRFVNGVVELLAIEEYQNKNKIGFDLYGRMQEKSGFDWVPRFKNLINSFEKNGYNNEHYIQLAKDFAIMDGSHRLMLSYSKGMEFINAKVYNTERDRIFNWDYFWQIGFSSEDCFLLKKKRDELLNKVNYDFIGIIWPPAFKLADSILNDINVHGEGITVKTIFDKVLDRNDFRGLFKGLYHTDILDDDGMEYKLELIDSCLDQKDKYPIKIFSVHCDNPRMSMNMKNSLPQSVTISRIKQWVRKRYENKITNYQYDVIIHICDNYLQTMFCNKLITVDKDISDSFNRINQYNYCVIRNDGPNQHDKFPYDFFYHSNVNILVSEEDLNNVEEELYLFSKLHFNDSWFNITKTISNGYRCINIFIRDYLLFKYELCTVVPGMNKIFSKKALSESEENNNIKKLSVENEIIARVVEYTRKPQKRHHLDYIRLHKDLYNLDKILLYTESEKMKKMVLKLFNTNIEL